MIPEPQNFSELLEQRKASAKETLRAASDEELVALVDYLFPDGTHPWAEAFREFIQTHRSERSLRGETFDGIGFVYFPTSNRGIWFHHMNTVQGVGLLSDRSLAVLADISRGKSV